MPPWGRRGLEALCPPAPRAQRPSPGAAYVMSAACSVPPHPGSVLSALRFSSGSDSPRFGQRLVQRGPSLGGLPAGAAVKQNVLNVNKMHIEAAAYGSGRGLGPIVPQAARHGQQTDPVLRNFWCAQTREPRRRAPALPRRAGGARGAAVNPRRCFQPCFWAGVLAGLGRGQSAAGREGTA